MKIFLSLSGDSEGQPLDKVTKNGKKLEYRGMKFTGWNKPIDNPTGSKHKRCVLAKKGNRFKLVKYGNKDYEDYTTHKDKDRRDRYHKRHKAILKKDGTPAYKDKFQAAYWALKDLW